MITFSLSFDSQACKSLAVLLGLEERNPNLFAMKNFALFLLLFSSVFVLAQEKAKEAESPKTITIPAPYKGIEIENFKLGAILQGLPFDTPIILHGKNTDNYVGGSFSIWQEIPKWQFQEKVPDCYKEVTGKMCGKAGSFYIKKIYTGELKTDETNIYAIVNKYLRANKLYRIELELIQSPSNELLDIVNNLVIRLNIELGKKLNANNGLTSLQIDQIRKEVVSKYFPRGNTRFIKQGSLLDIEKSYNFTSSEVSLITLDAVNDLLIRDIEKEKIEASNKMSAFLNSSNFKIFTQLFDENFVKKLRELSQDSKLRARWVSGAVNLKSLPKLEPPLSVFQLNESVIQNYLDNIQDNLVEIQNFLDKTELSNDQNLEDLKAKVSIIKGKLNELKGNIPNREAVANNTPDLLQSALTSIILNANSTIVDITTSAQWYVAADIGALLTNLNNTPDSWKVLPYAGMNLYFKPVNKNADIKSLIQEYKWGSLLRITSLHFGVTIPNLNTPKYSGIYNIDSPKGLIAGIGIRPWRAVRINTGWMFINRSNSSSLNPSSTISARQYFSISLDWDVRNTIPNIKSFINN